MKLGLFLAFKHQLPLATILAEIFGFNRLRIMPEDVSKLVCSAMISARYEAAVLLIGIWADALVSGSSLDRANCSYAFPMLCFYSETNERSKDWSKQWALLWTVTCSCKIHRNSISHDKTKSSLLRLPIIYKASKPFRLSNKVIITRMAENVS